MHMDQDRQNTDAYNSWKNSFERNQQITYKKLNEHVPLTRAVGLMVSEKILKRFFLYYCKSMGANDPWIMVCRIYVEDH